MLDAPPGALHRIANAVCSGDLRVERDCVRVELDHAPIDALVAVSGHVLRTSQPDSTQMGIAQVRRIVSAPELHVLHLVFAPHTSRRLLMGMVHLHNRSSSPLYVQYSELWAVEGPHTSHEDGVCACVTPRGERVLADVSSVIFGHAPEPSGEAGLALDLRLVLKPGGRRQLAFAYVAPERDEPAAPMIRAWRGDAPNELARTVRHWERELRDASVEAYRKRFN